MSVNVTATPTMPTCADAQTGMSRRHRSYARRVWPFGLRLGFVAAGLTAFGTPSAVSAETVRFDGVRTGLGGALVVSTWPVDRSAPVEANAFASLELGGAIGHFGFWSGASFVFPGWTNICTAPAEPFGCSASKLVLMTGIDWLGARMRIGPWIGVAETSMPSIGVRVEWLPLDVGRVGTMGFSMRASALAFPPFAATVPAVGVNAAVRFDLFADRP